jgi:hypothetical protein
VRGKGELYAVACFVTRVQILGFVTLLNFTLKIRVSYVQSSILYKLRLNEMFMVGGFLGVKV